MRRGELMAKYTGSEGRFVVKAKQIFCDQRLPYGGTGRKQGFYGDWLITGHDGTSWFCSNETFKLRFIIIDEEKCTYMDEDSCSRG